jgi:uracil-DNA glycosylase
LEFVMLCKPKLIMAVGRVAERWLPILLEGHEAVRSIPIVYMVHPSHIRQMYPNNGHIFRRAVETLRAAVVEHVVG